MDQPRLLAAFAHPDDEAFGCGGTLARYAHAGAAVTLVCATRGEVGEISDPALATPETLPQVREAELRNACAALGIPAPIFLGYRDSGMAGTADNDNPQSLHQADLAEAAARVADLIRQHQPQVVITFDEQGGYGHPDHIAIQRATVRAFEITRHEPHGPQKLYYMTNPREQFAAMIKQMQEADPAAAASIPARDLEHFGMPLDQISTILDVSAFVAQKRAALESHATQFGPNSPIRRIPHDQQTEWMAHEYFMRVAGDGPEREDDLFAGVDLRH